MTQPILSAEVAHSGPDAVLHLRGEIDYDTRPIVRDGFHDALSLSPRSLVVDMSHVSFCDSAGFGTLIAGRQAAAAVDCEFVMVDPSRNILKVIKIMGLQELFNVHDPTASAVRPTEAAS